MDPFIVILAGLALYFSCIVVEYAIKCFVAAILNWFLRPIKSIFSTTCHSKQLRPSLTAQNIASHHDATAPPSPTRSLSQDSGYFSDTESEKSSTLSDSTFRLSDGRALDFSQTGVKDRTRSLSILLHTRNLSQYRHTGRTGKVSIGCPHHEHSWVRYEIRYVAKLDSWLLEQAGFLTCNRSDAELVLDHIVLTDQQLASLVKFLKKLRVEEKSRKISGTQRSFCIA